MTRRVCLVTSRDTRSEVGGKVALHETPELKLKTRTLITGGTPWSTAARESS